MSKHFRQEKRAVKPSLLIGAASVVVLAAVCACALCFGWLDAISAWIPTRNTTTTGAPSTTTTTVGTTATQPLAPPDYRFPEQMKGVWLTPDIDYFLSSGNTEKQIKQQIDAAFTKMNGWDFNTLILPMHRKGLAMYPSTVLETVTATDNPQFEPLAYLIDRAREKGLYVYGVVDLYAREDEKWDLRTADGQAKALDMVKEQVTRYSLDGYFVSGFTFAGKQVPEGGKAVAEAALTDTVKKAVALIRDANRNHYVGLLSNGIWAHKSVDERGSNTAEYYEEFTDGRADTLSWIADGTFDCVMVQNYASTNHPTASFKNVLSWWNTVAAQRNVKLYIAHNAAAIGSYKTGWKLTDQLAQQYLYCKATDHWSGSVYDSLTPLVNDKSGIADTLKKAYAGTLNEEFIYKTLTVSSPQKKSFTTTASTVKFEGGGDRNFPLYINGKEVELTEHGFFTESFTLSIGVNTFKFTHKGATVTYTVTYKQTLLESVSPAAKMTVEGGNPFVISAVARKGSTVKATLNGQTVTLTPIPDKADDSSAEESDFETFSGSVTLPKGTVGKQKALGAVSVSATYNGLTETKTGGTVTLEAVPQTTTTTTPTVPSGALPMPETQGSKEIVVITADYAETFSGGKLVDDYSRPYNSQLPRGTWDHLAGKVYNGSFSYYLLASGKRVYMKDAKLTKAAPLKSTALSGGTVKVNGSHTVLTFKADWNIPVYLTAGPQSYYRDTTSGSPYYGIEKYGQTAEAVYLTFCYVTSAPKLPDLTENPLFSKAEWVTEQGGSMTLKLTLRQKGAFYGFTPVWGEDGTFTVSFLNPVDLRQNLASEKLKGLRILIDPGHGSPKDKPWEAPFNLDYANTLKDKLESLGAIVTMTRTGPLTTDISLEQRANMAQGAQYHMFISVHMNGANGKATGATVWYYHEYAYTASKYVYDKMRAVEVTYGVGTKQNGTPRSSGTNWGTLYLNRMIHDCPAILLECAFLDNPKDKEALIDPLYRDKLMQAVTEGVVQFFSAQSNGLPQKPVPTTTTTKTTTTGGTTVTATTTTTVEGTTTTATEPTATATTTTDTATTTVTGTTTATTTKRSDE